MRHHHDRARHHRQRGRRHAQGRVRLPDEAAGEGGAAARPAARHGAHPAGAGEPAAQGGAAHPLPPGGDRRLARLHAGRLPHRAQGGGVDVHGPHLRRERDGQGAGGARAPPRERPAHPAVLRGQRGRAAREHPGGGAVRLREGRLHRRRRAQDRPLRTGLGVHALPGRGGGPEAGPAGEAAAHPAGAGDPARGRHRAGEGGRAHRGRHQPGPGAGRARGQLPRGPVLPAQRHPHHAAALARAPHGHPAAGGPLRGQVRGRHPAQRQQGGAGGPDRLRLARQRARAGGRRRARAAAGGRRPDRPGRPPRVGAHAAHVSARRPGPRHPRAGDRPGRAGGVAAAEGAGEGRRQRLARGAPAGPQPAHHAVPDGEAAGHRSHQRTRLRPGGCGPRFPPPVHRRSPSEASCARRPG